MKTTLTTSQAAHLLLQDENASWSYPGAYSLIEYLEDYEDSTGEEIEFDRVALRCEYHEYASAVEAALEYSWEAPEQDEDEELADYDERKEDKALDYLRDHTTVIEFDGGVVIALF